MANTTRGSVVGHSVSDYLAQKRIDQMKGAGITFPKIAAELSAMAFSNIEDYVEVNDGGEVNAKPLDTITSKKLKAVKKIKEKTNISEKEDGTTFKRMELEYELYDKAQVLQYCVKLLGEEPADQVNHQVELSPELDEMINRILADGAEALANVPSSGTSPKGKAKR